MVKILNCYLYAKKSYSTLSKGAIFFGQPCSFAKHAAAVVFKFCLSYFVYSSGS